MTIGWKTIPPMHDKAGHGQFEQWMNHAYQRPHHGKKGGGSDCTPPKYYGMVGPVVSQPPKNYGVVGPVVSQPPKHHGVAGPIVTQPPKHPIKGGGGHDCAPPPHHGVAGPIVSQPPKHHGVAGPIVTQPPKHPIKGGGGHDCAPPPHHGVAGPIVSQPPKHHGVAGPIVTQPPKHPIKGGGGNDFNQPPIREDGGHKPGHPDYSHIYKDANKFHVDFKKHEYKGKHNKYDVAHFEGPRSQYKFDYASDNKVSVTDLKNGKKSILENIEGALFGKSVKDARSDDPSFFYDDERFYRLAIDGKGIGEGAYKDILPNTNMLNSTKPNANGVTNVSTGGGDDLVRGSSGNDNLSGNNGDDIFWGSTGSDKINGGQGFDTSAYEKKRENYWIWKDHDGNIRVRNKSTDTGEDILTNIENLRFDNGNFNINNLKFDPAPYKTPVSDIEEYMQWA